MNLIILEDTNLADGGIVHLGERYARHLADILNCKVGDRVTVGQLNGPVGIARLDHLQRDGATLRVESLDIPPPPTLPLTLVLALPRPRMLQRTLQTVATLGVEKVCLIQTRRVEKSFWQTPLLRPEEIRAQLIIGLEQAKATQLPTVTLHKRFRPFVEDELPDLAANRIRLLAHLGDYDPCPHLNGDDAAILAVGPEGGFIDHEVEQLRASGFRPVQLGRRVLRVETAVPALLARLYL